MNGAKVLRRTVYESEQIFSDSGTTPHLGVMVDELGKNKTDKSSKSHVTEKISSPTSDSSRDLSNKLHIKVEEKLSMLNDQDQSFSPNNLLSQQCTKLLSPVNINNWPNNFGIVAPGIFRSGFPTLEDYPCLENLRLKTILSLVKKDFSSDFQSFVGRNNINHIVIDMAGTKKVRVSESMMREVMSIVLDYSNHPILIHCNQGRHRTGCTIAVFRYFQGWDMKNILQEYRYFAAPKERDCDVEYIVNFKKTSLGLFTIQPSKILPRFSLINPRTRRMLFFSIVLMIIFTTLRCSRSINFRA